MTGFRSLVHRFLTDAVVDREEVDRFLDPAQPKWARFDPDLGYLPHDSRVPDGIDGAASTYTYGSFGERLVLNGAGQPCRINTYGDSFTQCHQVSDGETWQEHLAAHLGEPIRNFGVGGFGVYQAYLRLRRVEETTAAADHVVFNIYLDDHYRSLDAYRRLRVGPGFFEWHRPLRTSMFHANPWRHVRFDPSGQLVERPNPCPTAESLYQMCDPDFMVSTFEDDLVVQLLVGRQSGNFDFLDAYADTAAALGLDRMEGDGAEGDGTARSAEAFFDRCAFRASLELLGRMREELAARDKRLLVLLSYPGNVVADACRGKPRPDEEFVRQLADLDLPYVDGLAGHVDDYAAFTLDPDAYVDRYYHGHYTPTGNHFFAFLVKPAVREWLEPGPPAYAPEDRATPVRTVQAEHLA